MGKAFVVGICVAAVSWFLWLYYAAVRDCYAEDRRTRLRERAKQNK